MPNNVKHYFVLGRVNLCVHDTLDLFLDFTKIAHLVATAFNQYDILILDFSIKNDLISITRRNLADVIY